MFIFGHAPPSASFKYANFGAAAHELGIGRLRSLRASEPPVPRPPSGPMGVRGAGGPPKILGDGRALVADEDRRG